jgi:hypothetical protein
MSTESNSISKTNFITVEDGVGQTHTFNPDNSWGYKYIDIELDNSIIPYINLALTVSPDMVGYDYVDDSSNLPISATTPMDIQRNSNVTPIVNFNNVNTYYIGNYRVYGKNTGGDEILLYSGRALTSTTSLGTTAPLSSTSTVSEYIKWYYQWSVTPSKYGAWYFDTTYSPSAYSLGAPTYGRIYWTASDTLGLFSGYNWNGSSKNPDGSPYDLIIVRRNMVDYANFERHTGYRVYAEASDTTAYTTYSDSFKWSVIQLKKVSETRSIFRFTIYDVYAYVKSNYHPSSTYDFITYEDTYTRQNNETSPGVYEFTYSKTSEGSRGVETAQFYLSQGSPLFFQVIISAANFTKSNEIQRIA